MIGRRSALTLASFLGASGMGVPKVARASTNYAVERALASYFFSLLSQRKFDLLKSMMSEYSMFGKTHYGSEFTSAAETVKYLKELTFDSQIFLRDDGILEHRGMILALVDLKSKAIGGSSESKGSVLATLEFRPWLFAFGFRNHGEGGKEIATLTIVDYL